MFALSDGVADPRGLAGYFNTTRRSLFGSPVQVQRLDGDVPGDARPAARVNLEAPALQNDLP